MLFKPEGKPVGEWQINLGGSDGLSNVTVMITFNINTYPEHYGLGYPASRDPLSEAEGIYQEYEDLTVDGIEYYRENENEVVHELDWIKLTNRQAERLLYVIEDINPEFKEYIQDRINRHYGYTK